LDFLGEFKMFRVKHLAAACLATGFVAQAGLAESSASGEITYEQRIRCATVLMGLSGIMGENTEQGRNLGVAGFMWLQGARAIAPQHEVVISDEELLEYEFGYGVDIYSRPSVIYEADEDLEADSKAFWKEAEAVLQESGKDVYSDFINSEMEPCIP
jgi:hypothetical protein